MAEPDEDIEGVKIQNFRLGVKWYAKVLLLHFSDILLAKFLEVRGY